MSERSIDHATAHIIGNDEKHWPGTLDAAAWAKAWMMHYRHTPEIAADEATMLGWFANAIMTGFDEAQRRAERRNGISDAVDKLTDT